jgi:quercetin dioxygenase-like cupin family protein
MSSFANLLALSQGFEVDAATRDAPVKRMFVFDGESVSANIATTTGEASKLHTQPDHDEIVIVIEGEVEFRVGDEVRQVGPGDIIFIPRNTLHGRVRTLTASMSALSIYAPFFDRTKNNIVWEDEK